MKRPTKPAAIPLHDYDRALQTAVSWLGDRYLLAEPVKRRPADRSPYFSETPRWHTRVHRSPAQTRH